MDIKYRRYNIVICGTGATGSQLIPSLTQLLAFREDCELTFIDGDRVETKNLRNQKFLSKDNGRPKSMVLQKRYNTVYPNLKIGFMDEYIKDKERVLSLLYTHEDVLNIIVGCVDNNPTRKILREVFHDDSVPNIVYIDSGNGTESMQGQIVTAYKRYIEKVQVPHPKYSYNVLCSKSVSKVVAPCAGDLFPEIISDKETVDQVTSCGYVSDKHPQNIATNIMAASTLFCIINQIIGFEQITPGITYFDAKDMSIVHRPIIIEESEEKTA